MAGACPIPYPDRFHVARFYVSSLPEKTLADEPRLLLYALEQQAVAGPCNTPKPWGWNVIESTKWQSWKELGNMPALEAMRHFVRCLDDEQPEWWSRLPQGWEAAAAALAAAGAGPVPPGLLPPGGAPAPRVSAAGGGPVSISDVLQEGAWVVIQQDDGRRPVPRYEQGAALLGTQIFMLGGHYAGRYLEDLWVYDLDSLQWSQILAKAAAQQPSPPQQQPKEEQQQQQQAGKGGKGGAGAAAVPQPVLPPSAGHSVTAWGEVLLVVGGHTKAKDPKAPIAVRLLDPATMEWVALPTTGPAPCARGGHSATLLGDRLYVFGGEDCNRRPLADLHILDLISLVWTEVEVPGKAHAKPAPRCGHAAVVHQDKLVVFGGGSIANVLNDTWLLDLDTLQWTQPSVKGPLPAPRAGHASVLVGEKWFILGGGNNVKGCTDMLCADLSEASAGVVAWKRVAAVPAGSPLSSEGVSLLHCPELGLLLAFGGYNGKYHNTVSAFKLPADGTSVAVTPSPAPPQQQQPQQQQPAEAAPAAAAAAATGLPPAASAASGSFSGLPLSASEKQLAAAAVAAADANGGALPPATANGGGGQGLLRELAVARETLKRELAAAQAAAAAAQQEAAAAREAAGQEVTAAGQEIALLRRQLAAAQGALGDAERALEDSRQQLSAEQARTLRLEAELAELTEKLGHAAEREQEVERQKKLGVDSRKGSGLWGYITGSDTAA